ncbi:MAG: hypothetical protein ABIH83_05555 [Candidatus Micrarchaeota archaeon]
MNVNIGDYYEAKLAHIIARGVAANKTEALRMAITAYERQLEEEGERMAVEKLRGEVKNIDESELMSLDDTLKKFKIKRKELE